MNRAVEKCETPTVPQDRPLGVPKGKGKKKVIEKIFLKSNG